MPKDGHMSFQDQCTAQAALVASTWADYQAAVAVPVNPQNLEAKRAAHCAALNGAAYALAQHFSTDMTVMSGGTEKPKSLAF